MVWIESKDFCIAYIQVGYRFNFVLIAATNLENKSKSLTLLTITT